MSQSYFQPGPDGTKPERTPAFELPTQRSREHAPPPWTEPGGEPPDANHGYPRDARWYPTNTHHGHAVNASWN